jgi:drug/metabolite transporter (DMT)-like permease
MATSSHLLSAADAAFTRRERRLALVSMCSAALLFATMSAVTKVATRPAGSAPALSGGELAFYRYFFGLVSMLVLAQVRPISLSGNDRKGLIWRGMFGGIASTCFFLGIQYTSLTNATMLNYTFVIWAPLLAVFVLGEKPGWRQALGIGLGLSGVALVTRPEVGHVRAGDLVALFSGVMAGAGHVQIRKLRQGETSYAIFFYYNLLGIPCAMTALLLTGQSFHVPAWQQIPLLLMVGATSTAAQLLMTYGYRVLTTAQGSLISLTTMIYSTGMAFLFFQEPLPWTALLGGALILFSALTLTAQRARPAALSTPFEERPPS